MGNGDNRSHFFGTIVSCLLCALSLFARREHFAAFIDVISRQSEDVPVVIAGNSIHLIKTKAPAKNHRGEVHFIPVPMTLKREQDLSFSPFFFVFSIFLCNFAAINH